MIFGISILMIGMMTYLINKYSGCGMYLTGYTGVVIQGFGLGLVIAEFNPWMISWGIV